jgi:nitroreductase
MSDEHAPMPTAEGLAEPLRSRWSPSVFDDAYDLTDGQLETLLHAAQWAPSWGNSQPWRFFVARRGDATHAVLVDHLSRGNSGWVPRASVVLLTATQVEPDDEGEGGGPHAAYDLGQAAAHVTIQAASMGLHAHQFAGFDRAGLAARLGVPPHHALLSGIAVGRRGTPEDVDERTRGREDRVRQRKPLEEFVYAGAWGTPWRRG